MRGIRTMKTITIDGVKHTFHWDASPQYLSWYRSQMNKQKKCSGDTVRAYKQWYFRKHNKNYAGEVLKTLKDFKKYNELPPEERI